MEILRAGEAPLLIRRRAAEGDLPVSLEEKIEILVTLCHDPDEATRTRAFSTLEKWDASELKQVFSNPATPAAVLEFAVCRLVPEREEVAEALVGNPALPGRLRKLIRDGAEEPARQPSGSGPASTGATEEEEASQATPDRQTLLQKINRMTVAEKINTALMGNQEERTLLVRDSNKIVARTVLQSPKLSEQEAENIATMKSVSEEVLRLIARNRKFIKIYGVARSLVNNPRTPIDVGLPLINRLNERDLKDLSRNKNVAEVIQSIAFKLVKQKEDANKPKLPHKH
ncbi:MAG TPA: hypothetical protein VNG91_05730 [Terriglobia bacterium]|nr:hypothetical protein [Terriglobia bacterium]